MPELLESSASRIAKEEMRSGSNCCQSVLVAAGRVWDVQIGEDLLASASLFGRGMESGCTCGALIGMGMAAGLLAQRHPDAVGARVVKELHDRFKEEFGATCCRVIRKKHGAFQNIGNRACIDLTGRAASILVEVWEAALGDEGPAGVGDHSHP